MPSRLYSTRHTDHYFICIGDEVYNYREVWTDKRDLMLDCEITLSSIIDGTMAERKVEDKKIKEEVLKIVAELKNKS